HVVRADEGHGARRLVGIAGLDGAGHEYGQTGARGQRLVEVEGAGDRRHRSDRCLQSVVDHDVAQQGVADALDEERHAPGVRHGQGLGTLSPTLDRPANCGAARLHSGKLPSTKSDSVAVGLWDERVSAMNVEKQPCRPRAVRSTPSSRNSPAAGWLWPLLFVYDQGTLMGALFTI